MRPALGKHAGLWLAPAAFLLGILGTVGVMSRGGSGPDQRAAATAPGAREAGHDEHGAHEHEEEQRPIVLTAEARRTAGIRVEPVRLSQVGDSLTVPGTVDVSPNRGARVTSPASGKLVRLLADPGQRVRAGQPLAILDSFEVAQAHADVRAAESEVRQAQAGIQTARAETDQARAGVSLAQAEVRQARTKLQSARTALARQRELAEAGAFSQAPLQAARSELSEAQSELIKAQTELQSHLVALQRTERLFKEELVSRSELEQAQLEHRQDQTRVEQAQARVALAKQALEREQKVFGADLLSKQAVQTAEAEVRSAEAEVQKANQSLLRARQDVTKALKGEQAARTLLRGAQSALEAARANLYALEGSSHVEGRGGLLTIRAPLAGTITERPASLGAAVERTTVLFVIENLGTVLVHANVPERDVARVRVGQPVEVTAVAYPGHRFPGVVQSLAGRVDGRTRTLAVRCLVENRGGRLRPDMFARVDLTVGARRSGVALPPSALDEDRDGSHVFVEERDGFHRRPVQVGRVTATQVEVLSGLKPGERVVVEGLFALKSESRKGELKGHEH